MIERERETETDHFSVRLHYDGDGHTVMYGNHSAGAGETEMCFTYGTTCVVTIIIVFYNYTHLLEIHPICTNASYQCCFPRVMTHTAELDMSRSPTSIFSA